MPAFNCERCGRLTYSLARYPSKLCLTCQAWPVIPAPPLKPVIEVEGSRRCSQCGNYVFRDQRWYCYHCGHFQPPERKPMKYFYDVYWGALYDSDPRDPINLAKLVAVGYSGHQPAINDIHSQSAKNVGPIPTGTYTLVLNTISPEKGSTPIFDLRPATSNRMFGRDSFMIHGDTEEMDHTASDGCIVMAHNFRQMLKAGDTIVVF
jgi:ribosomal protein L37E